MTVHAEKWLAVASRAKVFVIIDTVQTAVRTSAVVEKSACRLLLAMGNFSGEIYCLV